MTDKTLKIRKLLINTQPRNQIEADLKRMYLKRIKEMFKRAVTLESIFNMFDEIFHGISQTSSISENLHSFYESFLTITSYYQHSQAGRGSLVAKLLEELGTSERIEFEFVLRKIPLLLGQSTILEETELTKTKFDIVNKNGENLSFCELKMKVYSGCTAGRIELMEKFNKFVKLVIENQKFRDCIKKGNIKNIFLIGGVLFDIQGEPATKQKDKEWGICYNGLLRGREDIMRTLENFSIEYEINENNLDEKAFAIKFTIDGININIIAVYGNEIIKSLFAGKQKHDINYFKTQLEEMLYDDLWLGQIITLSERAILDQNFKKNKRLNNFVTTIVENKNLIEEIKRFQSNKSIEVLQSIVANAIEIIKVTDKNLLQLKPIPAELIIRSSGVEYDINDYLGDIIQFLSCNEVVKEIKKELDRLIANN